MNEPVAVTQKETSGPSRLRLESGSRVAVVGGGPAGSFFSFFLQETASRIGLNLHVDIYEPKVYSQAGPAGCNMCGGIISESLVQLLATEGVNLPPSVVQRGIASYTLHMDVGSVQIATPVQEKRIAAVHRGAGPRGLTVSRWDSFDGHLLELAKGKGATVVAEKVEDITWRDGKPRLTTKQGTSEEYDLVAMATGINSGAMKLLEKVGQGYRPPKTTKTSISEFRLDAETIKTYLGSSMHVFLLNMPRLEFAALIPKGEYVTAVLLGREIDKELVTSFLNAPEVVECFPPGWTVPADFCRCFPSINVGGPPRPYANRLLFLGDCGESRLYKDGIGGAYRTAKAAAKTAVFEGVSADDFRRHFLPVCRDLAADNAVGKLIFGFTGVIQGLRFTRRGILRMVAKEQGHGLKQRMSGVLWDVFTGSAPYRDVFRRTLHPFFLLRLVYETAAGFFGTGARTETVEEHAGTGELGRIHHAGEVIIRQGEAGECMYVIQSGRVEVIREHDSNEICLAELGEGDFFGEMALFEKEVRSATVRAIEDVRVLTVDKKLLLKKIHQDPSLAFRMMQRMAGRVRKLDGDLMQLTESQLTAAARLMHGEGEE